MNDETYYKSLNVDGKDFNFKLIKDDCVSNFINRGNFFEYEQLKLLNDFLPHEKLDVGLDVGANIGNHTVYFSKFLNFNSIYAFEPQFDVYEILEENLKLNNCNNVAAHNIGLSNTSDKTYSISRLVRNNFGATEFSQSDSGKFIFKRIDDLAIDGKVDFIKIDVEGMEQQVLEGAVKTLARNKPLVWVECWDWNKKETGDFRLHTLLELGYGVVYYDNKCNYFFR